MRDGSLDRYRRLSLESQHAIDQVCSRFEDACCTGDPPDLGAFLGEVDAADRPALFTELLALELEYLERKGERPGAEAYASRFPSLARIAREVIEERARKTPPERPRAAPTASGASGTAINTSPLAGLSAKAFPPRRLPEVAGYEVFSELGHGGMGVVYKARDVRLNRLVALKMIVAGDFATPHHLVRFLIEGETLARLRHPNIVQVYEVGQHEGKPFLALEYVEGITLSDRLKQVPLAPRTAALLLERLARTIHYAHLQGIIHRDLKPANILLREKRPLEGSDSGGQLSDLASAFEYHPMITDFGLAHGVKLDMSLTESGMVLGTPSYMAPEQARSGKRLGPAVDVYGLGAILYDALAGRPPFRAASPAETIQEVVDKEPPRPSGSGADVPVDLETICLKCLEKDPARRYVSAEALADDLTRWLNDEPISARPVGRAERARKWARRNPLPAALAATLSLSLVLGLVGITAALFYALQGWREADSQRADAERAQARAESRHQEALAAQDKAEAHSYFSAIARARLEWQLNNPAESEAVLDECDPARRGWEWHYLKGLHHVERLTIPGHAPYVYSVTYSPDGRYLASSGGGNPFSWTEGPGSVRPGEVKLWDPTSGRLLRTLSGHTNVVSAVAFHPGGRLLASIDFDGKVLVHEAATGAPVRALQVGKRARSEWSAAGVAFSPDGRRLAAFLVEDFTASTVRIWDVDRDDESGPFAPGAAIAWNESPFGNLSFTPDARHILGGFHTQCLWEAGTGKEVRRRPGRGVPHLGPDGKLVAVISGRNVELSDAESGQLLNVLGGHLRPVRAVAFSRDGLFLATAGADQSINVWDLTTFQLVRTLRGHRGRVSCLAFDPQGHYLVSGDQDPGEIKVWELARPPESDRIPGHTTRDIGFARGSRYLLQACKEGLEVWDLPGQRLVAEHPLGASPGDLPDPLAPVAYSGDGERIALVARDRADVRVWDLRGLLDHQDAGPSRPPGKGTPTLVGTFGGPGAPLCGVALDAEGRRVATASFEGSKGREVNLWEADTGRPLAGLRPSAGPSSKPHGQVALSPDGRFLAYDDYRPTPVVRVRDIRSDQGVAALEGLDGLLGALAFSPDGRHLAGADSSGHVLVWDTGSWSRRAFPTLQGPARPDHLSISPNGRLLAAINREEVCVWELSEGQKVVVLRGTPPRPQDNYLRLRVAWSPDGSALAATGHDNTISVWHGRASGSPAPGDAVAEKSRAFAWHLRCAEEGWPGGKYRALLLHTALLDELPPTDRGQRLRRGVLLARVGRWRQARRDYLESFAEAPPADPLLWVERGMLDLKAGDLDAYRRLRKRAGEVFSEPIDRHRARVLATLDLLGPPDLGEGRPSSRWADRWGALSGESPMAEAFLGLAYYRGGEPSRAVDYLQARLAGDRFSESSRMCAHLVLALAYHDLNQPEVALASRHEAERLFREITNGLPPEMPDGVPTVHAAWHWLPLQVLREEVNGVLDAR